MTHGIAAGPPHAGLADLQTRICGWELGACWEGGIVGGRRIPEYYPASAQPGSNRPHAEALSAHGSLRFFEVTGDKGLSSLEDARNHRGRNSECHQIWDLWNSHRSSEPGLLEESVCICSTSACLPPGTGSLLLRDAHLHQHSADGGLLAAPQNLLSKIHCVPCGHIKLTEVSVTAFWGRQLLTQMRILSLNEQKQLAQSQATVHAGDGH